jgi:hypothetical protein
LVGPQRCARFPVSKNILFALLDNFGQQWPLMSDVTRILAKAWLYDQLSCQPGNL